MSVIDKAIQHFALQDSKTIHVPEWNTAFIVKPLNLDEQRRLWEKSKVNEIEALVDLIVMKCETENGNKAFKLEDRKKLLTECDPVVISRLSKRNNRRHIYSRGKKNLKKDQNLFNEYQLAELLHKSVYEIKLMSVKEYNGWIAYFNIKDERDRLKQHGTV
jgi:hypothetical protein